MKSTTCSFAIILIAAIGCETPDERLVQQLAETSREVVQQHREVAKTQHEIAAGSQRLVDAVAESRREHDQLQRHLQQQRDNLDSERRAMAGERYRESLLAPILETIGLLLVAALPLVLCWYLLQGLRGEADDVGESLVREILINELLANELLAKKKKIVASQLVPHTTRLPDPNDQPPALEPPHGFPEGEEPPF